MLYTPSSSSLTAHKQSASYQSLNAAMRTDMRVDVDVDVDVNKARNVGNFLLWLQLWMTQTAQTMLERSWQTRSGQTRSGASRPQKTGYHRPRSLLPDEARSATAPRVLLSRRSKRILARGLPASRRYFGYEHLNARQLTGNQFLERAATLSVNGRLGVYRLEYKGRLCTRRPDNGPQRPQALSPKAEGINLGLCDAHLYPN